MPADLTLRSTKGSRLTHAEVDANFVALNAAKLDADAAEPIGTLLTSLLGSDELVVLRGGAIYRSTLATLAAYLGSSPAPTEPGAFTINDWTLTPIAGGLRYGINVLPSDGGSPITAIEYTLDGVNWIAFAGTGTGDRDVLGLPQTLQSSQIRLVNAINPGAPSDTKSETPLAAGGGGGDLNVVQMSSTGSDYTNDLTRVFGSNVAAGNHVLAAFNSSNQANVVSGTGATLDGTQLLGSTHIASALRTPNVAAPATSFPYSQSITEWYQGGAIEVSGAAPVFTGAFPLAPEAGASTDVRQIEVTVTHDNSIVLLIGSPGGDTTWTIGGGLTGGNHAATGSYVLLAYGKFNAGTHNITFQPSANNSLAGGAAAFVWRPGS